MKNIDETILETESERRSQVFTMTRNNRDDAPLNTFLAYYAFKAEERRFYIRYPNQHPN